MSRWLIAVLFAPFAISCATLGSSGGLKIDDAARERMARRYEGREMVLASSMYQSDFFGISGRRLADPRPTEIIELWRHDGSRAIAAPHSGEILRAGTPVKVVEVIFPVDPLKATFDSSHGLDQAPTAHTWLVLERVEGGDGAEKVVVILPRDIATEAGFEDAVEQRLASHAWVTAWLTQRDPAMLDRIYRKEPAEGMAYAEMVAALGRPRNHPASGTIDALGFTADYGDWQITFDGKLASKIVSLKAEAAEAARIAAEKAEEARIAEEKRKAEEAEAARIAEEKRQAEEAEAVRLAEIANKKEAKRLAAEAKKQAAADARAARKAEAEARREAARQAKLDAEAAKQRRIEEKLQARKAAAAEAAAANARRKAAAEAAKAEAEAERARRKAEAEAAKAEAEAEAARRKLAAEVAKADAAAAAVRKRAEGDIARADAAAAKKRSAAGSSTAARARPAAAPRRARLGASVRSASDAEVTRIGKQAVGGAVLTKVSPGGPAKAAGLVAGDVIIQYDGIDIANAESFSRLAAVSEPGKAIKVKIYRKGAVMTLTLTPADANAPAKAVEPEKPKKPKGGYGPRPGQTVVPMGEEEEAPRSRRPVGPSDKK